MNKEQRREEGERRLGEIKTLATEGTNSPGIAAMKLCQIVVKVIEGIEWMIAEDDADRRG